VGLTRRDVAEHTRWPRGALADPEHPGRVGPFAVTSVGEFVNSLARAAARLIPLALPFVILVGGTPFATEWLRERATRR